MRYSTNFCAVVLLFSVLATALAQDDQRIREKILERRAFTPTQIAEIDQNGDGVIDVRDLTLYYQSRPEAPPFALFEELESDVVADGREAEIRVLFSKPFTGTLTYQLSGPAAVGVDYELLQGQTEDLQTGVATGSQAVSGSTATIRVKTKALQEFSAGRPLVITLSTTDQNASYSVSRMPSAGRQNPSVHILTITPGDWGVYSGVLAFPDESEMDPQAVSVAITKGGIARFALPSSSLLPTSFEVPVSISSDETFGWNEVPILTTEKDFSSPGAPEAERDLRQVIARLTFGPNSHPSEGELEVAVGLRIDGLTASRMSQVFQASLSLQRIDL